VTRDGREDDLLNRVINVVFAVVMVAAFLIFVYGLVS
jgi:hypothetical protein